MDSLNKEDLISITMPEFTISEIVAIMSMLVSLTAVLVGPIVSFKLARRQIISPIGQKWIDELRDLVSTLLSKCRAGLIMHEGHGLLDKESPDQELLKEILFLEQKLQLMLNPSEKDHQHLVDLVGAITNDVELGASNLMAFGERADAASACCKDILKREWERVKYGES